MLDTTTIGYCGMTWESVKNGAQTLNKAMARNPSAGRAGKLSPALGHQFHQPLGGPLRTPLSVRLFLFEQVPLLAPPQTSRLA